jgi:diguanylate cyclase (GGDEF)-like protein
MSRATTPAAPSHSVSTGQTPDVADIAGSIGEVAYLWQIDSDALAWSPNACKVLNISDATLIASGRAFARLLAAGSAQTRYDSVMSSQFRDGGTGVAYQLQYAIAPNADMTPFWVEDTGRWFAGPDGRPARAHGMIRIITERRARQERLTFLSRHDDLTGEMNRHCLTEALGAALDDALRFRTTFGFLVVSVDDLARVNEALGFAVGDELIAACAKRLRAKMRGGDSLGRLSGNKFGIILKECTPEELPIASERFLVSVRDDVIKTTTGPVAVTASVGSIIAPRHAQTVHDILTRAHEALHAGRLKRRGAVEVFRPNVERDAMRRENMRASDEIISALNERRILAAFEPVVEAVSRRPAFHECLMRIRRTDGSLVTATEILPIAERLGLVRLTDHRMLEHAVSELAAVPDLTLSLNVSPESINDGSWWSAFTASLASHPGIGARLIVEITESAAIRDIDEARSFVTRLKDLGCRIAVDDFGAGYTSFRNLRKLGVDLIKIDGSFVAPLATSADDQAFVRTLIGLAQQLGLKTVAEWVQDEAVAAMLVGWGCDYLQGGLIGLASLAPPWVSGTETGDAAPARMS